VALAEIDLSNVIAGNASLAGDRTHQVARLDAVARSDRHEETGHSAGGAGGRCI
jgi:lipopolysaccharide/colanic/teichoic acid biosynthesis glycosyltransferase